MIASVAFKNFKALRNTSLQLLPLNLVIGPSGSGKTSLLQAIQRLRSLARLPLQPERGGEPQLAGGPEIVFRFAPPHEGIEAKLTCVSDAVCDLLAVRPAGAPGWPALSKEIGRARFHLFDHLAMARPVALQPDEELTADGGNLAAVIHRLREREPAAFSALEQEALRLLPEFTGLGTRSPGKGTVELALRIADGVVTGENLAQGALYTLAFLFLSRQPRPPALVCVEEVDRGIHPRLLREFRDMLYRLSYPGSFGETRPPVQVIATTHSPYMLDLFREHPEEVVITEKHGSEAEFTRLSERKHLAELLQEGSLGDMWFSGLLGGVPEEP